jgi:predicted ATPase
VSVSPLDLDGGTDSDAETLFVNRARAVRLGFEVDDATTPDAAHGRVREAWLSSNGPGPTH